VLDALYQARMGSLPASKEAWALQLALTEHLESIWEKPDEGIWEVRGGTQHFTFSKVMAWVAIDRSVKSAERFGLEGPLDHWRKLRQRIHDQVCELGYDAKVGAFVQAFGSKLLDSSVLLIPLVGFLPPSDPRVKGTVEAIEKRLVRDGFVYRYDSASTEDGLPAGEGAFLACSFWLVDNLILQGRREDARHLFEQLLAVRNDVGLLAEEYDPESRRQVGNFPQAFSHVALIGSALNFEHAHKPDQPHPAEQRSKDGSGARAELKMKGEN
jgi:GH15 family glucan-1,4-alpha-glucosidase